MNNVNYISRIYYNCKPSFSGFQWHFSGPSSSSPLWKVRKITRGLGSIINLPVDHQYSPQVREPCRFNYPTYANAAMTHPLHGLALAIALARRRDDNFFFLRWCLICEEG